MTRRPTQYKADSKLEARIAFILMKAGVPGPEIDECLLWALGPRALYRPIYPDWIDQWRKLHPEYTVKDDGSFVEWIAVVGFLFVQWKRIQLEHKQKFTNLN